MDGHRLLLEKTICLLLMVNVIVSAPRTASRVRRICWFLANTQVRVRAIYLVMGDRGFRTAGIMAWCDDHPVWHFRLRLK